MTTLKTTFAEIVKETTTNLSVLMTINDMVIKEEVLRAKRLKIQIHKLIKKRNNLLGMSNVENKVQSLTHEINALRSSL